MSGITTMVAQVVFETTSPQEQLTSIDGEDTTEKTLELGGEADAAPLHHRDAERLDTRQGANFLRKKLKKKKKPLTCFRKTALCKEGHHDSYLKQPCNNGTETQ